MTEAARIIRERLTSQPIEAAIILGSSLDAVTAAVEHPQTLSY